MELLKYNTSPSAIYAQYVINMVFLITIVFGMLSVVSTKHDITFLEQLIRVLNSKLSVATYEKQHEHLQETIDTIQKSLEINPACKQVYWGIGSIKDVSVLVIISRISNATNLEKQIWLQDENNNRFRNASILRLGPSAWDLSLDSEEPRARKEYEKVEWDSTIHVKIFIDFPPEILKDKKFSEAVSEYLFDTSPMDTDEIDADKLICSAIITHLTEMSDGITWERTLELD